MNEICLIKKLNFTMKKILYSLLGAGLLFGATACEDFLETSSPSETTADFVFSDPTNIRYALYQAYETWRASSSVHSNGLFYDVIIGGSDAERHPEAYSAQGRHIPENLYGYDQNFSGTGTTNITLDGVNYSSAWSALYKIIASLNSLCAAVEATPAYEEMKASNQPSLVGQLYGEAIALRATAYYELMRFFGDVPHQLIPGQTVERIAPRDSIAEYHLNLLMDVEPRMYRAGENTAVDKTFMTRTYVQGLIGRIAMLEGGYQTRRGDLGADFYKDLDGNTISFDKVATSTYGSDECFYGRRTDYKDFYEIAKKYLSMCVENPGPQIALQTTDPRATSDAGQEFGNPYQYIFQQMNDLQIANENIYELPESPGVQGERPYAFGRPSDGGKNNYYPCKAYGQSRFHAVYYYGDFQNEDMRRDVTCAITASDGAGAEKIISFAMGSKSKGGIVNNKWDENRMAMPWTKQQRQSGINCPYMRFSDMVLLLAEAETVLGDEVSAKNHLKMIHDRAFGGNSDVDAFIASCGNNLLDAILQERKLEFGGEGQRRYDMIRNNKLYSDIAKFHERSGAMIAGLETQGYYTFPETGNTISNYIWTKKVDAKSTYGYRLTTQCTDTTDPVLYPGWRGQNDDWKAVAEKNGTSTDNLTAGNMTNIAIKGLFEYIDPEGEEAKALEADGYVKTEWGINIVKNKNEYDLYVFNGLKANEVPVYLIPIHRDQITTSGGALSNGYGFPDK